MYRYNIGDIIMKFGALVKQGKLTYDNPELLSRYLLKFEGSGVVNDIKKRYYAVSNKQYKRLYGAIYDNIKEPIKEWIYDMWGETWSVADIDRFFKSMFWYREEFGEKIPKSKTSMTTADMVMFQEKIENFIAEHMGIVVPKGEE